MCLTWNKVRTIYTTDVLSTSMVDASAYPSHWSTTEACCSATGKQVVFCLCCPVVCHLAVEQSIVFYTSQLVP